MTSAQEALVIDSMWLVCRVAGRMKCWMPKAVDMEELTGAGNIGLVKAALKFDPSMGVPFAAYARLRIRGEILDDLRRRSLINRYERARGVVEPRIVSFDERLGRGRERIGETLSDARPDQSMRVERDDAWDHMRGIFHGRERRIFEMLHRDGLTQKEVGCIIGVSESLICVINKRMVQTIRQHVSSEALDAAS